MVIYQYPFYDRELKIGYVCLILFPRLKKALFCNLGFYES